LLFADKRRCVIRIKGNKAEETRRNIYQIIDRHWFTNLQHIKDTKGAGDYLRFIGTKQDVRYPLHWKKEIGEGNRHPFTVQLSPHSTLYQQILKLVYGTWDGTKVGIGFDGVGLTHTKIVVNKIFVCQNDALFQKYDVNKKIMCKDASVNRYASVKGLKGEQEIGTRNHITGNNSTTFCVAHIFING